MAKRIYWETLKKWWKQIVGVSGVGFLGISLFVYLSFLGAIEITGNSGDSVCAGTIEDPCIALINFTAKEDIFIYPIGYDPWGRDSIIEFSPAVKSWKMQRSWGTGWRNIPLDKSCTGTWCGLSSKDDKRVFSYAFRKGRDYQIRILAYKNNPSDTIKWSVNYEDKEYLDPVWEGIGNITKLVVTRLVTTKNDLSFRTPIETFMIQKGQFSRQYVQVYSLEDNCDIFIENSKVKLNCSAISVEDYALNNNLTAEEISIVSSHGIPIIDYNNAYSSRDIRYFNPLNDTVLEFSLNEGQYKVGFRSTEFTISSNLDYIIEENNLVVDGGIEFENVHYGCTESNISLCLYFTDDATDSSAYGNDGTVSGATHEYERYSFDGIDDSIALGDIKEIDNVQHFTISVWAKASEVISNYPIFAKTRTSTSASYRTQLTYGVGGHMAFIVANGSNSLGSVVSPTAGEWHHFVMIYDGTGATNGNRLKAYIDGVNQTLSFSGTIPTTTADIDNFNIGRFDGGKDTWMNGSIDEFIFWNRTLSHEEIEQVYAKGLFERTIGGYNISHHQECSDEDILGCYLFDGDATDSSGEGNDGTVTGATLEYEMYDFDGINDYINISALDMTSDNTNWTVSLWFKAGGATGSNREMIVHGTTNDWWLLRLSSTNVLTLYDDINDGDSPLSGSTVFDNQWYNVLVRFYANGSKEGYLNGVLDFGGVGSGKNLSDVSTKRLFIGARTDGTFTFNGSIAEVTIWNRTLSPTEILGNYSAGVYTHVDSANFTTAVVDMGENQETNYTAWYVEYSKNSDAGSDTNLSCRFRNGNYLRPNATDPDLVGYWKLNYDTAYGENDSYAYDYSGNGFNLSCSNCPSSVYGYFDGENASEFNAGDSEYFPGGNILGYENTSNFSVAFWMKLKTTPLTANIIGKQLRTGDAEGWSVYTVNTDILRFILQESATSRIYVTADNGDPYDGKWHHWAVTYNGSSKAGGIHIYKDGTDMSLTVGQDNLVGSILTSAKFSISSRDGADWFLNGTIDEVAIWNRTLSSSEIMDWYSWSAWYYDEGLITETKDNKTRYIQAQCRMDSAYEFDTIQLTNLTFNYTRDVPTAKERFINVFAYIDNMFKNIISRGDFL